MTSPELERLVTVGLLKREPPSARELDGLIRSGAARLRAAGYRSEHRYVVFQALPHTARAAQKIWRVLAKCHGLRNQAEYEGVLEIDERLVEDLIVAARAVRDGLTGRSDRS
jgi:hypothetical protein